MHRLKKIAGGGNGSVVIDVNHFCKNSYGKYLSDLPGLVRGVF